MENNNTKEGIALLVKDAYNQEFTKQGSSCLLTVVNRAQVGLIHNFAEPRCRPYLPEALNLLTYFYLHKNKYGLMVDDLAAVIEQFCNTSPAYGNAMMGFYGVKKVLNRFGVRVIDDAVIKSGSGMWKF